MRTVRAEHGKAYLGNQRSNGGHHTALDYAEVGAFLKDVRTAEVGSSAARLALQFVAYTCVRSNEADRRPMV